MTDDPQKQARRLFHRLACLFAEPVRDLRAAIDAQFIHARRPALAFLLMFGGGVAIWWVYVPVHELLHAAGCYLTGGSVSELQIAPEYGAALFARIFPFVVSGGQYAGRLAGFDTHGSDLVYLATDAMPFLLTILIGVPVLKASARGGRPLHFAGGFVLGIAPFYCLTGDYYEMGSIITTRIYTLLSGAGVLQLATLRTDDLVQLAMRVWTEPAALGLHSSGSVSVAAALIIVSEGVGIVLAGGTYALGAWFARWVVADTTGKMPVPPLGTATQR